MAANNTSDASVQRQKPYSLAARLAEAAEAHAQPSLPEPALARFIARHWSNTPSSSSSLSILPSGLKPDEAAALASAVAVALHDYNYPLTSVSFRPENVLIKPVLTGWLVTLEPPGEPKASPGPALTEKTCLVAFAPLLYRLAVGQQFAEDRDTKKAQLSQLHDLNPYLAVVLEQALAGGFASAVALAGAFGWSLYRTTHLNFAPAIVTKKRSFFSWPDTKKPAKPVQQLPVEVNKKGTISQTWGGPLGLVSLAVALVLLTGTVAFSLGRLDSDNRQQSPASSRPPLQTAIPTPSPAVALQISRQSDGASLTRYNPAFDQSAGQQYTNSAQLATGNVAVLSDFRNLFVQSTRWSADGKLVDLALNDGGWETWDIAAKQRLARKELPNTEQYQWVSWSPDGHNFIAAGLDGQLDLGKADKVVKTVSLNGGVNSSSFPALFSWSPNSAFVLMWAGNNIQVWNFHDIPTQIEPPENSPEPVMNTRGNYPAGSITWSPDSRFLARIIPGSPSQPGQVEFYNPYNLMRQYVMEVVNNPTDDNNNQIGQTVGAAGLAWSPDGRFMAILRAYQLLQSGTTNDSSEGTVVSILELPELSDSANPLPVGPILGDTPGPSGTSQENISGSLISLPLKPVHLETLAFTGLGDEYNAAGRNMAWSNNNRLLVMGNKSPPDNAVQRLPYQALILDLQTSNDRWDWITNGLFEMPFPYSPAYVGWLPDNRQILFNFDNQLAYTLPPDQAGKTVTTEILYKGSTDQYFSYLPSPNGRNYLLTQYKDIRYLLTLRDSASGQVRSELEAPPGLFSYPGRGLWSADSRVLAIPFTVRGNNSGGTGETEEIVRAWRFEPGKPPVIIGDLLIPGAENNVHSNEAENLAWDSNENVLALLFEFQSSQIGRWDLSKPLLSLEEQRRVVVKNAALINPPASAWTYFQIIGKISGTQATRNNKWTWLPDQKQLIYCSANSCFIQQMLASETLINLDRDLGTGFEPQPFSIEGNPAVSPDGRMVAVGLHSGLLNLYDAKTGKLFNSFPANLGIFSALNFSPDGRYLVASGNQIVKVWDATSWRLLAVLRLVTPNANSLSAHWLPDNKTLAVGNIYSFGALLLWRALP